jgi:heptaprenyl diphosphate synthase
MERNRMSANRLTHLALYTVLAMVLYGAESLLPPLVPIPGIKLGLSNVVTLIVLHRLGGKDAFLVLLARILLSSLVLGQMMGFFYSLFGGMLSFASMLMVSKFLQGHFILLISITGAISHNLGQILTAAVITVSPAVLVYLPYLLISGMITGCFIGFLAWLLQRYRLEGRQ